MQACQVQSLHSIASTVYSITLQYRVQSSLQAVQAQLSAAEKVDKLDDSPVTVADYGAQALVSWVLSDGLETGLSMVAEEDSASLT
jgi:3'-phosphoadenosine 5'-phosphosulfate (PAPS) 3'-phosphatase